MKVQIFNTHYGTDEVHRTKIFYSRDAETRALHCPHCGKHALWKDDYRDYYVGHSYTCIECSTVFGNLYKANDNPYELNKLTALRKLVAQIDDPLDQI